jgi:hypothetical protein
MGAIFCNQSCGQLLSVAIILEDAGKHWHMSETFEGWQYHKFLQELKVLFHWS